MIARTIAIVAATALVLVAGTAGHRLAIAPARPVAAPGIAPPTRRRVLSARRIATVIGGAGGVALAGWFATGIAIAAVVAARRARPLFAERRRRQDAQRQLPEAIERIVLLVHAGLTSHQAVRSASESVPSAIRPAFDLVTHRLDRGAPLGEALLALPESLGPRAGPVADAFAAADRLGLPLEPMLDQLARDARAERRRLDDADARRLPVRLTFPLVTCTLPSFVLVAIAPAVLAALSSLGATPW